MSTMIENMRRSNSNLIADRLLSVVPDRWRDALQGKLEHVLAESQNDGRAGAAFVREKVAEYETLPGATYTAAAYDRFLLVAGLDGDGDEQDYGDDLLELDMSLDHISDRAFADATAALESWRATKNGKQTPAPSQTIAESNQALIDGTSPQAVREFLSPGDARIEAVATEEGKAKLWKAKISHADKLNANRRIYPRECWEANLARLKPLLKDGVLGGAIDHAPGWSSGSLKDTCLIWRDLWMEADGGVYGKFEIIGNALGESFKAQIKAGLAVGFSTSGDGSAHEPTDAERKRYGLGEDTYAAVMHEYTCKRVDAVDDPSVADARLAA